jgi:hypothetical protein
MDIKSFKTGDMNIMSKIVLTKSEAIGLCSKNYSRVKKGVLAGLIEELMRIPEIDKAVQTNNVMPRGNKKPINVEELKNEAIHLANS